jgi:hypothetical protein
MERGLREVVTPPPMSDQRPKRDSMSIEEATVSNMWEIAAIVEVLERNHRRHLSATEQARADFASVTKPARTVGPDY